MILTFLTHQWKAFWRSKSKGRSIAMRVVLFLFVLYLLLNMLVLAFFVDKILEKTFPGQEVLLTFNSLILYYFLLDLLMRFQMQELPTLSVRPYLNLRIRKNRVVNYLSLSSMTTAFNIIPFLLTVPFLINVVLPAHGQGAFAGYLVCIAGLTLFNHFFSLWFKRRVNLNAIWLLGFFILLLALISVEFYAGLISISSVSTPFFTAVITNPLYSVVCLMLAAGMYIINHNFLKKNLYLDELSTSVESYKSGTEIPFLDRFGIVGDLAANELKLIFRNKRSRSVLMMSLFFMLYGLIFYTKPEFTGYTAIVFCGMFMTGIFIIQYGQFMFSWQSAHFDGLLTKRMSITDFFKAKFLLMTLLSSACFILTIPYVYFGWRVLLVHFIMYIWNLGVNTVLVLWFANHNYKRIDLAKGGTFNWEGVGASQWILSIPLLLAPFIVYLPFNYWVTPEIGLALLTIIGALFIVTRDFWLQRLTASFNARRYTIAEGFRNK
jgi:hypothetical protein